MFIVDELLQPPLATVVTFIVCHVVVVARDLAAVLCHAVMNELLQLVVQPVDVLFEVDCEVAPRNVDQAVAQLVVQAVPIQTDVDCEVANVVLNEVVQLVVQPVAQLVVQAVVVALEGVAEVVAEVAIE